MNCKEMLDLLVKQAEKEGDKHLQIVLLSYRGAVAAKMEDVYIKELTEKITKPFRQLCIQKLQEQNN